MALAGGFGAEIALKQLPRKNIERDDFALFSESNSRLLIEVAAKNQAAFEKLMKGKDFAAIGKVTQKPRLTIKGLKGKVVVDAAIEELDKAWKRTLSGEEA
jgi:phosphoribosylformylglycinamidine synthase